MVFENSFSVRAPIDEVWAALLDVERVAPCVPGARVLAQRDEDVYELRIDVALGAAPVTYQGQVAIVERDAGDRSAVLSVVAAEADGDGRAEARLALSVVEQGELTEGRLAADVALSAEALVAIDRGLIRGLSEDLIDGFARNLAAMLGGGVATVNGADPESSRGHPPVGVDDLPPGSRPARAAPGLRAASEAAAGETAADPGPATSEMPGQTPPTPASPGSAPGSWAARQAGAAVERLRTPLLAMLFALVTLGVLIGYRRRARGVDPASGTAVADLLDPAAQPAG